MNNTMYPIKFKSIYFNKVWGGRDFESFRYNLPQGNIGESWDVACHENGISIIENGYLKGMSLKEVIEAYGTDLLGKNIDLEKFPLLIKLINTNEILSVQVHPDDNYALNNENSLGKTEAWYVIDADNDSDIIVGTKNCEKCIFEKAIKEGKTAQYLNNVKVKKGDFFIINSGLVHGIGKGVIIAEIQQNSDITYRLYDYGRNRELHVNKALDVINFDIKAENSLGKKEVLDGYEKELLCINKYFTIEKYIIKNKILDKSNINKFFIYTCVDGEGTIVWNKNDKFCINKGDSIFIPATLGEFSIEGKLTVLKSYT